MENNNEIKNKDSKMVIIDILRYVFTIPATILIWLLATNVVPFFFTMYFLPGSAIYEITQFTVQNVVFVASFLLCLYYIPPKHHLKIITVISGIYLVWLAFCIIMCLFVLITGYQNYFETLKDWFIELAKAIVQGISVVATLSYMYKDDSPGDD